MNLGDTGACRQRIFLNTETTTLLAYETELALITYLGLGKYGLRLPIKENIDVLVTSPTIGSAVSKGAFATKVFEGPNGAGLLSARNGGTLVAVGPSTSQLS